MVTGFGKSVTPHTHGAIAKGTTALENSSVVSCTTEHILIMIRLHSNARSK